MVEAEHPEPEERERPLVYPEWSTRTHAVHAAKEATHRLPPRPPSARPWPYIAALGALVVLVGLAILATKTKTGAAREAETDIALTKAAAERLGDVDVRGVAVAVYAQDQVLVALGRVPDERTRDRVLDALALTPGAQGVVDRITIETRAAPRDEVAPVPERP